MTPGASLVLGVGNVLLRDEGVGVVVARALADDPSIPPDTEIVDGGTLGLDLLPMIGDAGALIMIDAVNLRSAPGTIRILRGDELHVALAQHVSPHQVGVNDLVALARLTGTLPAKFALVGIQPEAVEVGLQLTPHVEAALPAAIQAVRDELAAMAAGTDAAPALAAPAAGVA